MVVVDDGEFLVPGEVVADVGVVDLARAEPGGVLDKRSVMATVRAAAAAEDLAAFPA